MSFPLDKLDFISGDFDSHSGSDEDMYEGKFILTLDQEKQIFIKRWKSFRKEVFQKLMFWRKWRRTGSFSGKSYCCLWIQRADKNKILR